MIRRGRLVSVEALAQPTLERGQQFGEIEFAVRRDRQARARRGNADFGKAPGAPEQRSPLQLHGELADCEQGRAIGLGQAQVLRLQAQGIGIETDLADRRLARQLGLPELGDLILDHQRHQPKPGHRIRGQRRPPRPPPTVSTGYSSTATSVAALLSLDGLLSWSAEITAAGVSMCLCRLNRKEAWESGREPIIRA